MDDLTLTTEQGQIVIDLWNSRSSNPPSLKELVVAVFGEGFDGRSLEARAVKKFLAQKNLRARTSAEYQSKSDEIELNELHKQYITNNVVSMNAMEISRIIFANPSLSNLSAETRAVNEFIKTLNPRVVGSQSAVADVPKGDYQPPQTFDQTLKRIQQYINYVPERNLITPTQKKNIDTLLGYLHTYRFIAQMNSYDTEAQRRLCEDAFIRGTYDKADLMQEEIDQYIEYGNQVVQGVNTQRRSNILQAQLEQITSSKEPEAMKISMGLVEAIGKASTEINQIKQREQKLLDDLKQKRSVRLSKQLQDNASILNLVQAWKQEDTRKEMLAHAEKEQKAIAKEVDRLSDLPEFKARILGLVKDEIRNG